MQKTSEKQYLSLFSSAEQGKGDEKCGEGEFGLSHFLTYFCRNSSALGASIPKTVLPFTTSMPALGPSL